MASYETALAESLPTDLKASLPTIEEIEAEAALYEKKSNLLGKKPNQMQYKDYVGEIAYDDEAKIFHGEVIGLKDIITFQGKSIEELEESFKASVEDYLTWTEEMLQGKGAPTILDSVH